MEARRNNTKAHRRRIEFHRIRKDRSGRRLLIALLILEYPPALFALMLVYNSLDFHSISPSRLTHNKFSIFSSFLHTSDPLPFFVPTETGIFACQGPPESGFRA